MNRAAWRVMAVGSLTLAVAGSAAAGLIAAGKPMPAWSGKTLAGKPLKSSDLKGKVVVMNFFSYG